MNAIEIAAAQRQARIELHEARSDLDALQVSHAVAAAVRDEGPHVSAALNIAQTRYLRAVRMYAEAFGVPVEPS